MTQALCISLFTLTALDSCIAKEHDKTQAIEDLLHSCLCSTEYFHFADCMSRWCANQEHNRQRVDWHFPGPSHHLRMQPAE